MVVTRMRNLKLTLGCLGTMVATGSFIAHYTVIPVLIKFAIRNMLVIEPGTLFWDPWLSPQVPVFSKIYLFNVTNPDDIQWKGAKPIVQEIGPYVYEEKLYKQNVTFSGDSRTVSFRQYIDYSFRPDLSNGLSEDDQFTIINIPYMSSVRVLNITGQTLLGKFALGTFLKGDTLFMKQNMRDIIWSGLQVSKYVALYKVAPIMGILVPPYFAAKEFLDGSYALLEGRNHSGVRYRVYSGRNGTTNNFSNILEWNDAVGEIDNWLAPSCNKINGTDVMQHPPFVNKSEGLKMFLPEICRSLNFEFVEELKFKELIPGYRFRISPKLFQYGDKNPDNWCFCTEDGRCPPNGIFNLTMCRGGPMLLSKPHFLDADPEILSKIDGLSPDPKKHDSYFDVEPISGIFLDAKVRLQASADMEPYAQFHEFERLPKAILPLFWLEESGSIAGNDYYVSILYTYAVLMLTFVSSFFWICFALGFSVAVTSVFFLKYRQEWILVEYKYILCQHLRHGDTNVKVPNENTECSISSDQDSSSQQTKSVSDESVV